MRIAVDTKKCTGHARCWTISPDIYVLNDDGYNEMPETVVAAGMERQARRGALACPERAITIIED
jgi:ferredoxin